MLKTDNYCTKTDHQCCTKAEYLQASFPFENILIYGEVTTINRKEQQHVMTQILKQLHLFHHTQEHHFYVLYLSDICYKIMLFCRDYLRQMVNTQVYKK